MIAKTYTCSLLGIDAILVEVEVDISPGFIAFTTAWGSRTISPREQGACQSGDTEQRASFSVRADYGEPGACGLEEGRAGVRSADGRPARDSGYGEIIGK